MTIQPYHRPAKRLRLVPATSQEGRRIAREIAQHQRRAKTAKPSHNVPELSRWHTI